MRTAFVTYVDEHTVELSFRDHVLDRWHVSRDLPELAHAVAHLHARPSLPGGWGLGTSNEVELDIEDNVVCQLIELWLRSGAATRWVKRSA